MVTVCRRGPLQPAIPHLYGSLTRIGVRHRYHQPATGLVAGEGVPAPASRLDDDQDRPSPVRPPSRFGERNGQLPELSPPPGAVVRQILRSSRSLLLLLSGHQWRDFGPANVTPFRVLLDGDEARGRVLSDQTATTWYMKTRTQTVSSFTLGASSKRSVAATSRMRRRGRGLYLRHPGTWTIASRVAVRR
jgi:hypothetical protein